MKQQSFVRRFCSDIKKYFGYTVYSAKCALNAEVASSHLSWLWWVLNPLLFMFVYIFIGQVVFKSKMDNFPIFVFIGLTLWDYFNKTVVASVKLVKAKKSVVSKVYLPKYILVMSKMMYAFIKMMISFAIIFIMMIVFKIPFTFSLLNLIPVFIVLGLVTFGFSSIVMHFGVFVDDLYNVVQVFMRVLFYMTGIFYSIEDRLSKNLSFVLSKCNPAAYCIGSARKIIMYGQTPDYLIMLVWFVGGLILSAIGIRLIYKYENSYAKVM